MTFLAFTYYGNFFFWRLFLYTYMRYEINCYALSPTHVLHLYDLLHLSYHVLVCATITILQHYFSLIIYHCIYINSFYHPENMIQVKHCEKISPA